MVQHEGESLVAAMEMARAEGGEIAAQLVAAGCVVEAETKDHQNWELIGRMAEHVHGALAQAMTAAYREVAKEEAHHLTTRWDGLGELSLDSLGVSAVLPPPEEQKKVETPIGAARAEPQREGHL